MRFKIFLAFIIDLYTCAFVGTLLLLFVRNNIYINAIAFSCIFTFLFWRDILPKQSLGKMLMKIHVESIKGELVKSYILILRNIFIIIWPIEVVILIISGNRRLGDYIVGTIHKKGSAAKKRINKIDIIGILFTFFLIYVIVIIYQNKCFLSKTTFTKKGLEEMTQNLTYTYNASKPHAVSEVGGTSISYDKNGNPIVLESDTLFRYMVWDEENRLTCLTDDSYRSIYTYNHAGERVVKSHGPTESAYINGALGGFVGGLIGENIGGTLYDER